MKKLRGTMVVMVTPFTKNDQVDEKGLRENIDWYISEGIHGLICTGSTSEFANLSVEEHKKVIDISVEQAKDRVPVMAGTACNSTKATIEMTKYAYDAGADAALIVSPFYGLPNQEELYTHFKAVADNVPIQVMLYNNPWYSGADMLPSTVARLAEIDNILYIKESTADIRRVHEIQRLCREKINVWCGWDDLALESLLMGCGGWVCPTANFLPKMCAQLFDLVQAKNYTKARDVYFKLLPLLNYLESGQLLAKTKEAMNMIGQNGTKPRKPFLPLPANQKPELRKMLKEVGLL